MDWLANNWIWIALAVGMVAMHTFGHGHGAHRRGHPDSHGADAGPRSDAAQERSRAPGDEANTRAPVTATPGAAGEDKHRHSDRRHGC